MADQRRADQLDLAIDALLARRPLDPPEAAPEIAPLVTLAAGLRRLPRIEFRKKLREDLIRRATTMTPIAATRNYMRPGFGTITPYLIVTGAARLIDFMKAAFDGHEVVRVPLPDGSLMHAEVEIGDSRIELADGGGPYPPRVAAVHLYVPDADAAYKRAIEAGALSLCEPVDQDYGDREASVKDPSGNSWYIATHKMAPGRYVPEGLRSIIPYLHARGADQLVEFMRKAFQAEEAGIFHAPDGTIVHAKIRIGDSVLELSESHGPGGAVPAAIHMYVPDADAVYAAAVAAGATTINPPSEKPYGERGAEIEDAFGNQWYIATYRGGEAR